MKQHILISLNSHKSSYETGKMLNSISKVRWLYEVVAKTPRWQALIIWNLSQSAFISSPWHKKCLWLKKDTPALVSPSLLEQILKAYHVPFHTLWNHPWCTAHLLAEKRSVGRTKKKKKKINKSHTYHCIPFMSLRALRSPAEIHNSRSNTDIWMSE